MFSLPPGADKLALIDNGAGHALAQKFQQKVAILGAQKGEPYHLLLIDNSLVAAKDFMEKSASAFVILGKYLYMQFVPYPLSCDYSYNQIPLVRWSDFTALASLLVHLSLAAVALVRLRKREAWAFGILLYLAAISLYSNLLLTIGTNFGERLAYLPSFGFCIAFVSGLSTLLAGKRQVVFSDWKSSLKQNTPLVLLVAALAVPGAAYSHNRNPDWNSYLSIYEADVNKVQGSARLNYWYGMEVMKVRGLKEQDPLKKQQYYDTALVYLNRALEIHPEYGDAYAQRGLLHYRRGEMDKAMTDYEAAARLEVGQWGMYSNLAIIYAQRMMTEPDTARRRKDFEEAMKNLTYALRVDDRPATIYKNMANLYHGQFRFQEAIVKYKEALDHITAEYEPLVPEIYRSMEECYRMVGDSTNAQYYRGLSR